MALQDSGASAPMSDADEELDALLARADAELAGAGAGDSAPTGCGELDDNALSRRTEGFLRRRKSEEELASKPVEFPMDPPTRFARKSRVVRLPALEQEQTQGQEAQQTQQERGSLVVSSLYPSFRAVTPQARIVRWSRKRKAPGEMTWDDVARPAHNGARLERAKALAGSVAYI